MTKNIFLTLALLLIFVGVAAAQGSSQKLTEQQKIELLIQSVEQLQDAEFIRSGTAYDAEKAASHLRRKLKSAGDKVKTAQDFIIGIASTSYFSGKPYYIRFKEGKQITSKEFFEKKLREIMDNTVGNTQ
ncbi:MAG: DUF5329 domain-containing protein [Prevotellaceae bacterium]|jgi:hypothetical protein|nr:DUF5329 domain-containing protein [Prevotellaceae bacterium]